MRSYCLEHGVAIRTGADVFRIDLLRALDDVENDLTARARLVLRGLYEDRLKLEDRIKSVSTEIKDFADADENARRLMTIPGVRALGATAILAAIGDPSRFRRARDVSACLGVRSVSRTDRVPDALPRQHSKGGKQTLLGIAKRGSSYLRTLLVHGARSVMMHMDRSKDGLGGWLDALRARMHPNKAVLALAAKIARIIWVVFTKPGAT